MFRIGKLAMALLFVAASLIAPQQQSPLPDLPPDIPKDATIRMVLTDKAPSGQDAVWKTPDGVIHEFFQFNDRGRGPKIYTTYRLDAAGLIVSEESKGVDYMKSPLEEKFSLASGNAAWSNQAENEKQSNVIGKFYIDLNGGPESGAILVRALLAPKNGGKISVLPAAKPPFESCNRCRSKATAKSAPRPSTKSAASDFRPTISGSMTLTNSSPALPDGRLWFRADSNRLSPHCEIRSFR